MHMTAEVKPGADVLGVPPPRVFCKKRLDLLDCKGVDFSGAGRDGGRSPEENRGAGKARIQRKAWLGRRFHAEG
jgi:hypothetical protein